MRAPMCFLKPLIAVLILSAPLTVFAEGGGLGSRGGGQAIVDIDNIPHMRDMFEKCEWNSAWDFFVNVPNAVDALEALKRSHWILGDAFEREVKRLNICLTSTLAKISIDDSNSITAFRPKSKRTVQIGVRVNSDIYLDHESFKKLPAEEQILTMFHEVIHSFIPFHTVENRYFAVQTASYAMLDNYRRGLSSEQWAITIAKTEMTVPPTTEALDEYKDQVAVIVNPESTKQARFAAIETVGFDRLQFNLFWKDYFTAEDEITTDYSEALAASNHGLVDVLSKKIMGGVKAEFPVLPFGSRRASLLEIASQSPNEETMKLLLSSIAPVAKVSDVRENALVGIAKQILNGSYETIELSQLIALGLPNDKGLRIIVDTPTPNDESFERVKSAFQAYLDAGVDLNQAWIPALKKKEKAQTLFSYAFTKNQRIAAHLLSLPSASLDVIENSALKDNERSRAEFVTLLARTNEFDALRKVLSTFTMRAFDRMELVGYLRAEKRETAAQLVESTVKAGE